MMLSKKLLHEARIERQMGWVARKASWSDPDAEVGDYAILGITPTLTDAEVLKVKEKTLMYHGHIYEEMVKRGT